MLQVGADTNVLRREAISLLLRTQHTQLGEESRVFPGLVNFKCSSAITSILFIAERDTLEDSQSVTLSVWQPLQHTDAVFTARVRDSREVNRQDIEQLRQVQRDDIALYRANFPSPLRFESGDVLGIDITAGLAIQYAYGWGPENYVLTDSEGDTSTFVTSPIAVQDTPLMTLGIGVSRCAEGLLSPTDLELFLRLNSKPRVILPFLGSPSISPLLRFTADGSVTRWSISRYMSSATELPELQIWRANNIEGQTQYQRVEGSSTDFQISVGSTTTLINQEISFRRGDILAVRSSKRVVLGDILLSSNSAGYSSSGFQSGDMELEHVLSDATEISLLIGEGNCVILAMSNIIVFYSTYIDLDSDDGSGSGSGDTSEHSQSIVQHVITTPPYDQSNVVFLSDMYATVPEFAIPHRGLLTQWVFAAQLSPTLAMETPELQVWRRQPNELMDMFKLVHSTSLLQELTRGEGLGTYEYTLEEPAQVEAGDVLGFFQPANNVSLLRLALLQNSGASLYELMLLHTEPFLLGVNRSNPVEMAIPLMSAQIILSELKLYYLLH